MMLPRLLQKSIPPVVGYLGVLPAAEVGGFLVDAKGGHLEAKAGRGAAAVRDGASVDDGVGHSTHLKTSHATKILLLLMSDSGE